MSALRNSEDSYVEALSASFEVSIRDDVYGSCWWLVHTRRPALLLFALIDVMSGNIGLLGISRVPSSTPTGLWMTKLQLELKVVLLP